MSAGRRKKPLILRSRDQIFAIYLDHDDIFNLGTKGNLFSQKCTVKKRVQNVFIYYLLFYIFLFSLSLCKSF